MERSLYVFAHNDDELSAFVPLRDDVREGREVYVVWLTESLFLARPGERPGESERAMALLGVPRAQLHFWGEALGATGNGTLLLRLAAAVERLQSDFRLVDDEKDATAQKPETLTPVTVQIPR